MTGVRTVTLTEFLLARIAEDEAVARAATDGAWTVMPSTEPDHDGGAAIYATRPGQSTYIVVDSTDREEGRPACDIEDADHVVRWQPARVLAECDAKRQIVALHETGTYRGMFGLPQPYCAECGSDEYPGDFPCDTLRLLALPYTAHPDCRDEWKAVETRKAAPASPNTGDGGEAGAV